MAENKKSFVLYCDLFHTVTHLTDEQAGRLFKHILGYVNDKDPQTKDAITNISFEPIKQQLKRDLKKWVGERKQRSAAGKKGMLKRWGKNKGGKITKHNGVINPITNITDNVTVSVNVNANRIASADFFELFKRAASPLIPDEVLWQEVEKLMEKYPGKIAKRSIPLINTWVSNIPIPKPEVKKMVH